MSVEREFHSQAQVVCIIIVTFEGRRINFSGKPRPPRALASYLLLCFMWLVSCSNCQSRSNYCATMLSTVIWVRLLTTSGAFDLYGFHMIQGSYTLLTVMTVVYVAARQ